MVGVDRRDYQQQGEQLNMVYTNEWYLENREKVLARGKKWRDANPELVKFMQERWKRENEGRTYQTPDGYVKYIGYEHPATNSSGITAEHRIVLWDKLGGKDANCHWCDKPLSWSKTYPEDGALITDHVNTVKNDNRPENLVPSCSLCNLTREGGQNRAPSPNAGRACEAIEGCDRPGATHSKNHKSLWVCMPHYMQDSMGIKFRPLRNYVPRGGVNETEKECMGCGQWLPHDKFYWRNGKPKGQCRPCEIKRIQVAREIRRATSPACKEDGCNSPVESKGMCVAHYGRYWRASKKSVGNSPKEINGEDRGK